MSPFLTENKKVSSISEMIKKKSTFIYFLNNFRFNNATRSNMVQKYFRVNFIFSDYCRSLFHLSKEQYWNDLETLNQKKVTSNYLISLLDFKVAPLTTQKTRKFQPNKNGGQMLRLLSKLPPVNSPPTAPAMYHMTTVIMVRSMDGWVD